MVLMSLNSLTMLFTPVPSAPAVLLAQQRNARRPQDCPALLQLPAQAPPFADGGTPLCLRMVRLSGLAKLTEAVAPFSPVQWRCRLCHLALGNPRFWWTQQVTPTSSAPTLPHPFLQAEAMPFRDNTRDLPKRYGYKPFLTGWHEIRQALYEPVADLVQFEHKVRHRHIWSSAATHAKQIGTTVPFQRKVSHLPYPTASV